MALGTGLDGIARDVAMVGRYVTEPTSEKGLTKWRGVTHPNLALNDGFFHLIFRCCAEFTMVGVILDRG